MSSLASALIAAIGWALIHSVWQGLLLGCVAALLLALLRNASPQARYALAYLALLFCIILPLSEFAAHISHDGDPAMTVEMTAADVAVVPYRWEMLQLGVWLQGQMHWIVVSWLSCVALLAMRLGLGLLWLRRYTDTARGQVSPLWQQQLNRLALRFGLRRQIILRVVDHQLESPVTLGSLRPVVLVPAALLTGMAPDLLEALLAHELAHIKRHDYLFNLIQSLIEMLLFYHPVVWRLARRIRIEREQIADEHAARVLGEPRRLALALSELELFQFDIPQLAQAAHGGNLMLRIKRLLGHENQQVSPKFGILGTVLIASGIVVALYAQMPVFAKPVLKDRAAMIDFNQPGCRPEYPRASLRREETGTVLLSVRIAADGAVANVNVDKSSGFEGLDNAVRDKLLAGSCKNQAAIAHGQPKATTTRVQYVWRLE